MTKIPITLLEEAIRQQADSINKLDDKSLPMVIAEIQAEEADISNIKDHRTITHVSTDAIEIVLPCWALDYGYVTWINDLIHKARNS